MAPRLIDAINSDDGTTSSLSVNSQTIFSRAATRRQSSSVESGRMVNGLISHRWSSINDVRRHAAFLLQEITGEQRKGGTISFLGNKKFPPFSFSPVGSWYDRSVTVKVADPAPGSRIPD